MIDVASLPPFWLRDNCPCPSCRDGFSGQKLFQILDLPGGLRVDSVRDHGDAVEVVWSPDGHVSRYSSTWLAANQPIAVVASDGRTEVDKQLWGDAELLAGMSPTADWSAYLADDVVRRDALDAVRRLGFVLLRGVPAVERQVLTVVESFGFVRRTNYGDLFDVRVEPNPTNLAFTSSRIQPHTDNPYRDPVPTIQALHCLCNDADGANSGLVDGFAAAAALRAADPDAFDVLARVAVPFEYRDATTVLRTEQPLIQLDGRGRIRTVRFNNRSIGTLRLPAAELDGFYAAYRTFASIILEPQRQLDLRLEPGDCLVFDNTRLLHARTAYAADGRRHLQGTYADLDSLFSTLALLDESTRSARASAAVDTISELFERDGAGEYFGEPVTQAEHMLQAAALAEQSGAAPAVIAAALLHDVGHFHGTRTGQDLMDGVDNHHSATGATWLGRWFDSDVTDLVRMHVAAKRYLCTVEPSYFATLSPASVHTLQVQGGPMTADEVAQFEADGRADLACQVRRWDEAAKDPNVTVPDFAHYADLLRSLIP